MRSYNPSVLKNDLCLEDLYTRAAPHGMLLERNYAGICMRAADSVEKGDEDNWSIQNRDFGKDKPLYIRIQAKNNASTEINSRVMRLYLTEKKYAGFPAKWVKMKTIKQGETASFGTIKSGANGFTKECFIVNIPSQGTFYLVAQITDANDKINAAPDSEESVALESLRRSPQWCVLDVDRSFYISG